MRRLSAEVSLVHSLVSFPFLSQFLLVFKMGGRPPGKLHNQNCESSYRESRNQQLLVRKGRVFVPDEADRELQVKVTDKM